MSEYSWISYILFISNISQRSCNIISLEETRTLITVHTAQFRPTPSALYNRRNTSEHLDGGIHSSCGWNFWHKKLCAMALHFMKLRMSISKVEVSSCSNTLNWAEQEYRYVGLCIETGAAWAARSEEGKVQQRLGMGMGVDSSSVFESTNSWGAWALRAPSLSSTGYPP